MEELIETLDKEKELYEKLLPVSDKKTNALVKEDLETLKSVTGDEQRILDEAGILDRKREKILKDISVVLGKKPEELTIAVLSEILEKQPSERKRLNEVHDSLKSVMSRLNAINERTKELIENSLEMIEFNMNLIQSTRMSSGSDNYNRNASVNSAADMGSTSFDAKQ